MTAAMASSAAMAEPVRVVGGGGEAAAAAAATDLAASWRSTIQRGDSTIWHGEAGIEVDDEDNTRHIVVKATSEVELLLRRLADDTWGMSPVRLPLHSDNARIVRMVAAEYPLKMRSPGMWGEAFDDIAAEERRATDVMSLDKIDPPEAAFVGKLMSHQQEAVDYIAKCGGRCLLADEMGLGKTVETLAYLAGRAEAYPVVVVAPLVAVTHWQREIERFLRVDARVVWGSERIDGAAVAAAAAAEAAKAAKAGRGGGSGAEREAFVSPIVRVIRAGQSVWSKPPKADFYIINYDLVHKWAYALAGTGVRTVVFDECQALRRSESRRYQTCRRLALSDTVLNRIALSGTPVYNDRGELHTISEVIRPGVLGSRGEFLRRWPHDTYTYTDMTPKERNELMSRKRGELATMLRRRFMLRRLKADVLDLPEKTRLHQEIDIDDKYYMHEVGKILARISSECERIEEELGLGGDGDGEEEEGGGGNGGGGSGGRGGLAERAVAGAGGDNRRKRGLLELYHRLTEMRSAERQIAGISKAGHVCKYVRSLLDDYVDDKFVVFCHHLSVREILRGELERYGVAEIAGGQKPGERQDEIDRFQSDAGCRVMLAGLRAGSVGISLSAASYVIFAELDWSPSIHRQAEDRLHRIGQKKAVIAHYLIGKGTHDTTIAKTVVRKSLDVSGVMGEAPGRVDNTAALEMLAERFGQRAARLASPTWARSGAARDAGACAAHARRILDGVNALRSEGVGGGGCTVVDVNDARNEDEDNDDDGYDDDDDDDKGEEASD